MMDSAGKKLCDTFREHWLRREARPRPPCFPRRRRRNMVRHKACGAEPKVRIHLPPPASQLRTWLSVAHRLSLPLLSVADRGDTSNKISLEADRRRLGRLRSSDSRPPNRRNVFTRNRARPATLWLECGGIPQPVRRPSSRQIRSALRMAISLRRPPCALGGPLGSCTGLRGRHGACRRQAVAAVR
jgi:hypothetical protein